MNELVARTPERMAIDVERARALLSDCTVDVAHGLYRTALAAQAYLRAAGASIDAQRAAAEVRLRAERWIGQWMVALPKHPGGRRRGPGRPRTGDATPSLASLGISKDMAKSARRLAAIADAAFEEHIARAKERGARITLRSLVRPIAAPPVRGHRPCVYAIRERGETLYVKIGSTDRPLAWRIAELQIGNPRELFVAAAWPFGSVEDAEAAERAAQGALAPMAVRGEWFRATDADIAAAIDQARAA